MRTHYLPDGMGINRIASWILRRDGRSHYDICLHGVFGWTDAIFAAAVIDDFGNLVRVNP